MHIEAPHRGYTEKQTLEFFHHQLVATLAKLKKEYKWADAAAFDRPSETDFNAEMLTFFATTSNQWLDKYSVPKDLHGIFYEFVIRRLIPSNPQALEIRGGIVLTLTGFFNQDGLRQPNRAEMTRIGRYYFRTAANHRKMVTDPAQRYRREGMNGTARHFRFWQQVHARLRAELEFEKYLFEFELPSSPTILIH